MAKSSNKKSLLKYLNPMDMENCISSDLSTLDIEESLGYLSRKPRTNNRFLNIYDENHILKIMKSMGLITALKKLGYENIIIKLNIDAEQIHYMKVYSDHEKAENLLIDLRVSLSRFVPEKAFLGEEHKNLSILDMVIIEWLSLERPDGCFTNKKPQLPGQKKPGLGCLKLMTNMMYSVAKGVTKDGFLDVPNHLHGAIMYSKYFKFFNPEQEGILCALLRDLKKYSLYDLSWGIITRTVMEKNSGEVLIYDPSEQIFPVSTRLKKYFDSIQYRNKVKEIYKEKSYTMDYKKMVVERDKILKRKSIEEL